MGVSYSFSITNIFYDKMDLRLFYFLVTKCRFYFEIVTEIFSKKEEFRLCAEFSDLEKLLIECLGWASGKLDLEKRLVRILLSKYRNTRRVHAIFSDAFLVQVGLHQGQVLNPLLFIIVLEALSKDFISG